MKKTLSLLFCCILLMGCASCRQKTPTIPPPLDDLYRTYYEIFVGSFYDSDGDGMGDLPGLRQQLDYLNDGDYNSSDSLHVTGIWLMPVMPSPTYHKYDVTDYYSIDPAYGTIADFEALAADCNARGISLILDLALNHTSSEHPWFRSACASIGIAPCGEDVCTHPQLCRLHNPFCQYYNFSTSSQSGFAPVSVQFADIEAYGADGFAWYYEARFWSGMPDLNLDNPAVRGEIENICAFWLARGIDGFRLDAVTSYYTGNTNLNTEFLEWLENTVKRLNPDAYLVAEAWVDAGTLELYYKGGMDSGFNFPFSQAEGVIIKAVRSGGGAALANSIALWNAQLTHWNPDAIDAPFLSNHDNARSAGALLRDPALQKQAAAVYLLLPGNPFIYYGEEIGMTGSGDDPNKRAPFIWSLADPSGITTPPPGTTQNNPVQAGVAEQLADPDSLLRFYIDAIAIRNRYPAIARGAVSAVDLGDPALCGLRFAYGDQTLLVVHNLGENELTVRINALNGAKLGAVLGAGGNLPQLRGGTLTLPARSTVVLELTDYSNF